MCKLRMARLLIFLGVWLKVSKRVRKCQKRRLCVFFAHCFGMDKLNELQQGHSLAELAPLRFREFVAMSLAVREKIHITVWNGGV